MCPNCGGALFDETVTSWDDVMVRWCRCQGCLTEWEDFYIYSHTEINYSPIDCKGDDDNGQLFEYGTYY